MGNKESQFDAGYSVEGKDAHSLDPTLIRSFTELRDGNPDVGLDKFQIVRILSNLRQYRLLSGLYEKAMRTAKNDSFSWIQFSLNDSFSWIQFSLSLISDQRFSRVSKILQQCIAQSERDSFDENIVIGYMQLVKLQIEHLGDLELAESIALRAVEMSSDTWLLGRCHLLLGIVQSLKAQSDSSFISKRTLTVTSIRNFEKAIELDPHDDVAHFYCALECAISRNLNMAKERCQTALDLNLENPFSIMLMALIFTACKDYKGALELVINALNNFPSHYGLLVLRLKLESKYGRVEEALQTSRNLIYFWRKTRPTFDCFAAEEESSGFANGDGSAGAGSKMGESAGTLGKQYFNSREVIAPLTPLLTAPLGICATPTTHLSVLAPSNYEMTPCASNDNLSTIGPVTLSEGGAPASTDSLSILTSSTKSWISYSAFRIQADIWVELAEFFVEIDRFQDVQACVEEACSIYPRSHQALYLKGRLYLSRSAKCAQMDPVLSRRLRNEAKNCFMGAISFFTAHTPSYSCLSRIFHADGNLKMAEKMLREFMAIDSLNFQSWHDLGRILAELGREDEALECFQTAATLDANTPLIPFQVIPRLLTFCD